MAELPVDEMWSILGSYLIDAQKMLPSIMLISALRAIKAEALLQIKQFSSTRIASLLSQHALRNLLRKR